MKTLNQLYIARQRVEMRAHALNFREAIHHESFQHERFTTLVERGALYLRMAGQYRNMALNAAKDL